VSDLATRAKRRRAARRARRRLTPFGAIIAAFVLLVGSAGAVVFAQLAANGTAPWVSTALSAAAIATTVLAVALRRRP
jgi:hypothetical protein